MTREQSIILDEMCGRVGLKCDITEDSEIVRVSTAATTYEIYTDGNVKSYEY